MRLSLVFLTVSTALFLISGQSYGTEEYAMKTGKNCGFCHVDPSGGGELTVAGMTMPQKVFYIMAYLNLTAVFGCNIKTGSGSMKLR